MRTGTLPAAFASALACAACTIVHVEGVKRPVIAGGVLHFEPAPGARHISFRTKGFGIVPGTRGVTLGAAREESVWVYDPQDCRIVVFSAPKWLADALVAQRDHFCVVGGEGKSVSALACLEPALAPAPLSSRRPSYMPRPSKLE